MSRASNPSAVPLRAEPVSQVLRRSFQSLLLWFLTSNTPALAPARPSRQLKLLEDSRPLPACLACSPGRSLVLGSSAAEFCARKFCAARPAALRVLLSGTPERFACNHFLCWYFVFVLLAPCCCCRNANPKPVCGHACGYELPGDLWEPQRRKLPGQGRHAQRAPAPHRALGPTSCLG